MEVEHYKYISFTESFSILHTEGEEGFMGNGNGGGRGGEVQVNEKWRTKRGPGTGG